MQAQITEREPPVEWDNLITGARFMDRFLPMPEGKTAKGIWGTDSVQNRYVDNGIELPNMSFWGRNIGQSPRKCIESLRCGENPSYKHYFSE